MGSNDMDVLEIERLFSDFAWHADRGEGSRLSELFVEDGVLCLGGNEYKGRSEIAEDVDRRARTQGRKTRHVWSNLRIVSIDPDAVVTTAIQLTFEQNTLESAAQVRINDLLDTLQRSSDGRLRFARRTIQREIALKFVSADC